MYTIGQAAIRAGLSVPLLRAWERRYGIVRPERTASGYRLYDEASIARLRAMRELVDAGWSPSQAARHIEADGVPPSMAGPGEPESRATSISPGDRGQTAAFVDAAAAMDEPRVESILDDIFATGSFERAVDDRLMRALRALGEAWSTGDVSVAAEHAASHAVLRRLSAAFGASGSGVAGSGTGGRPVLVGLPPGSRHELGALAFATAVRRRGISVVYLGADVPLQSWVDAVRWTKARAIVIGAPTMDDLDPAQEVARIGLVLDSVLVAIGGTAAAAVTLPDVLRLPDGIARGAEALRNALAPSRHRSRG